MFKSKKVLSLFLVMCVLLCSSGVFARSWNYSYANRLFDGSEVTAASLTSTTCRDGVRRQYKINKTYADKLLNDIDTLMYENNKMISSVNKLTGGGTLTTGVGGAILAIKTAITGALVASIGVPIYTYGTLVINEIENQNDTLYSFKSEIREFMQHSGTNYIIITFEDSILDYGFLECIKTGFKPISVTER